LSTEPALYDELRSWTIKSLALEEGGGES
jgi:hypothetical protein